MNYKIDFENAYRETLRIGLDVNPFSLQSSPINKEHIYEGIDRCVPILKQLDFLSSYQLNGRCAAVHLTVRDIFRQLLNIESYITIGSMKFDNHNYCSMSYKEIEEELASPNIDQRISAHVWLTFEDGSILDWTGLAWHYTNSGVICEIEECIAFVPANGYSEFHNYKPYLVGEDFLKRVGVI